jgi:hypothetical protein
VLAPWKEDAIKFVELKETLAVAREVKNYVFHKGSGWIINGSGGDIRSGLGRHPEPDGESGAVGSDQPNGGACPTRVSELC